MINNQDLLAVQAYITAKDDTQYDNLGSTTLLLDLTHSNLKQRHIEIRFDKHTTIASLRDKIHQKTGTAPQYQHLQIKQSADAGAVLFEIPVLTDDDRKLGYYSLTHGMAVHCIDTDPHSASRGGGYEDTSLVKRYVMSDEDYEKRKGTLRDWGRDMKKKDDTFTLAKHAKEHRELMDAQRLAKVGQDLPENFEFDSDGKVVRKEVIDEGSKENNGNCCANGAEKNCASSTIEEEYSCQTVQGMDVGMRCEVSPGNRRGSIAFVGPVTELGGGGYWVGIIFDEPVGKTDGTAKDGKRYFEAPGSNYGGFVRGKHVTVGDFPERDIMDELDSDSEDEL
jgi:tubulin-folding cofactor B